MAQHSADNIIVVDGVAYDIATGRAIPKQSNTHSRRQPVLDIRKSPSRSKQVQMPATRPKQIHPQSPQHKAGSPSASQLSSQSQGFEHDYITFVIIKGLFARINTPLWHMSLARTLASPQTWLILTFPLILLQVFLLRHYTVNQALLSAKNSVTPDHYTAIVWSIGVALIVFFLGVIIRSTITAAGMFTRIREIDKRNITAWQALRLAASRLWHQALNYMLHIAIIVALSVITLIVISNVLQSSNIWVITARYELVITMIIVWAILLIFLYGKHWLQVGLLALSKNPYHTQLQSIRLAVASPASTVITSIIGLLLIVFCYGIILFVDVQLVQSFLRQSTTPAFILLILTSILSIIVLTGLQYIQQNLWAHQYYYTAQLRPNKQELLYHHPQYKESLWSFIAILIVILAICVIYFIGVLLFDAQIKGFLANIHAMIPTQIKLVIPTQ